MSKPPPLFYVLHGDDEFTLKAEVRAMRAKLGDPTMADVNTSRFDGRTVSLAEIISAARMTPFLLDKRLVIVEGLLTRKATGKGKAAKGDLEPLLEALTTLPETARLVFVEYESLKDTNPVLKLAQSDPRGFAKNFSPPRDPLDRTGERWDTGWIARWISARVEKAGLRIEPRAATILASLVGEDLYAADRECEKMILYVGAGSARPITESDVAALTAYTPEANVFEIVDALGEGKSQQAAILVHRLLDDPKQQPLALLSMIVRQFRLLIQVREALDTNRGLRDLPDLARLPDRVLRNLSAQAKRFSPAQLEQVYRHLAETDAAIKTGRISDMLALDLLVAGL